MHTTSNTTTSTTTSISILQAFNSFAIANRFTGVQTQLWNYLYWLVCTYGQGVCIPTYHLLETMGISRSQLHRARKVLMDTGCLAVHKTGAQRTHYTVLFDGEAVDVNGAKNNYTVKALAKPREKTQDIAASKTVEKPKAVKSQNVDTQSVTMMPTGNCGALDKLRRMASQGDMVEPWNTIEPQAVEVIPAAMAILVEDGKVNCACTAEDTGECVSETIEKIPKKQSVPTGVVPQSDVVMNGAIVDTVKAFTVQHGYSAVAQRKLIQWCDMRKKNGWTMTAAGVDSTMTGLQRLCKGEEEMLLKIVDRTLQHHWKGFYPYRVDAAPSGRAYTAWQPQNAYSKGGRRQGVIPAYETERVDLSFLER